MFRTYIWRLRARIWLNKKQFVVYSILRTLVIATGIRCLFTHNYESLALCILSLFLFLLPALFEERLKIVIPPSLQIIIYLFIYAAEILGEVNKYYTAIPGWDTMLHTINGFLCAAIGLSLVYVLNRRGGDYTHLSPLYLAFMAFCFSMTIGVLWEFFEFAADHFFYLDMQKDFVISGLGSVTLDPTGSQIPVRISNITRTVIETAQGTKYVVEGGYLDVGINDTMKDLLVNFVGAVVFSIAGYFYEKDQGKKSLAADLMIKPLSEEEALDANRKIDRRIDERTHSHRKRDNEI